MASLTIRNIPEDAKRRFRLRAAAHGRSMEEEARQLIVDAADDGLSTSAIAEQRATYSHPKGKPAKTRRKSIGQMIYEMSRPGFDIPEVPDTPASFATFGDG